MFSTSWCNWRPSGIRARPHWLRALSDGIVSNICWCTCLSALQLVEPMPDSTLLRTLRLISLNVWKWWLTSGGIVTAIFGRRLRQFISLDRSVRLILDNRRLFLGSTVPMLNLYSLLFVVVKHNPNIISNFMLKAPIHFGIWLRQLRFVHVPLSSEHIKSRWLVRFGRLCGFLLRLAVKLPDIF